MAESIIALRERTGFEVLPENPPAHVFVGDLHPLTYYGATAERADCGLLLDLSHLAIAQQALSLPPTAGLDAFPIERVVEIHVAGGRYFSSGARRFIDDDHGPELVDEVWSLLEAVLPRATALRAVVIECERNRVEQVLPLFQRVRQLVSSAPGFHLPPRSPPPVPAIVISPVDHRALQRTVFRMLLDDAFARQIVSEGREPWLSALDLDALSADPGGRRAGQLLGNVALEFSHTVSTAPAFLEAFPSSPEFHTAIASGAPLPLAFASYAARVLPEGPWRALLSLETAMAELRRADPARELAEGCVVMAPSVRLLALPEGTLAAAEALARGQRPAPLGSGLERMVLCATGAPSPHRPIRIEPLSAAVSELIGSVPLDSDSLAAFAARHEAEPDEVSALVEELIRDGVLSRI